MKIKNFIFSLLVLVSSIGFAKANYYTTYEIYNEPEYYEEVVYTDELECPEYYEEVIYEEEVPSYECRTYRTSRPACRTYYHEGSSVGSNIVSGLFGFAFGSIFGAMAND